MTHGGGTVAGESPDKSEQRKSSGETTHEERDPRLTVFRQAAHESGSDRDTSSSSSTASTASTASSPAADGDTAPEAPPAGEREAAAPTGNDARLRAAVAAWVATDGDDGSGGEPADGPAPDAGDSTESTEPRPGSDADSTDVTPTSDADASADPAPDPAPGADSADGADADADRDAPDTAEESTPTATEGGTTATGGASPSPGAGRGAERTTPASAPADASADVPADVRSKPAAAGSAAGSSTGKAAKGPAEDTTRGTTRTTAGGAVQKASTDGGGASASALTPAPVSSSSADAKSEGRVDQPTTVFKALRRPPVDQPTTALKMPSPPPKAEPQPQPQPQPQSQSKPESKPRPEREVDAERRSTFVPLRRDDVRPAPAVPAGSAVPATSLPPAAEPAASLGEAERTRQQPMPPLPPLDLLAELTNTPPPPETPVRTAVRRVKIWTPLVLLLLIVFAVVQLVRPLPDPTLALTAEESYTFEGGKLELPWPSEGQGAVEVVGVGSLGSYGAQKPAPIASVAKTMTAYVILRDHPLKGKQVGPKITVDKTAEEESKAKSESTAPIKEGQQFTEKQMLQLLMIPSGNNAARLLARWDAGSVEAFVKKMNDAAKDLGMTNSTYTDPSGLKSSTVSTPLDQIKLGKAVMENDVFREIVNMTQAEIPGIDGKIRNNNDRALLMDGVGGIKTGSSTPAGGNLLWSANALVDGEIRRIIGMVMGAKDAPQLWQKLELAIDYSIALIPPAQEAVTSATVVKKGDVVGHVDDGLGGRTPVVATKDLKAVGWSGLDVKIEIAQNGKAVPHSARAGTVVGQVSVGEGVGKVSAPVTLQRDLAEPGVGAKITRLG
ncbi:serine hydrolase [Streptomyces sp. NPDC048389]|uniref:D-alanyl-D-alanine carboxypeptidase family protein n=1 Tax=Streptomyces sp. NPDC048389 TaxID=3154622 RepID=UPI0034536786